MAECIPFDGINKHFVPPHMPEEEFGPHPRPQMWGYSNGIVTYTRWELTPEEVMEIAKTGEVWIVSRNGKEAQRPTWVGSRSTIKQMCADFGRLWKRRQPQVPLIEDKRESA
jgi:acyl-ACP thioesterase